MGPRITSYINNLHPETYKGLYKIIERVVTHAILLWDLTLTPLVRPFKLEPRLQLENNGYEYIERPEREEDEPARAYDERLQDWIDKYAEPRQVKDEDDNDHWERIQAWKEARPIMQPEPKEFQPPLERIQQVWEHRLKNEPNFPSKPQVNVRSKSLSSSPTSS